METDSGFREKQEKLLDLQMINTQIRMEIAQGLDDLLKEFWLQKLPINILENLQFSQQDFTNWISERTSLRQK
jgi:hypothetical protein